MSLLTDTYNKRYKDGEFVAPTIAPPPIQPLQTTTEQPAHPAQPSANEAVKVDPSRYSSVFEMVRDYGKPADYTREINQAEKNRKIAQWNDILGMAGNIGTLMAGRRLFGPPVSATQMANQRLERLRELNRDGRMRYENALLNARLQDRQQRLADQARKDALEAQKAKAEADRAADAAKLAQDWAKFNADLKYKMGKDAGNLKLQQALEQGRNMRSAANLSLRASEGEKNRQNAITTAKIRSESKEDKSTVEFVGKNGRKTVVPKKSAYADAAYLYGRMQDIIAQNPESKTLEDITIQQGEGGTQQGKMMSIVQKRLQDFPELQEELDLIEKLHKQYPNATQEEWDEVLASLKYKPSAQFYRDVAGRYNDFMGVVNKPVLDDNVDYWSPDGNIYSAEEVRNMTGKSDKKNNEPLIYRHK